MIGIKKMNAEICKKCDYYPKFYELGKISDKEFVFYGYQDMEDRKEQILKLLEKDC